MWTAILSVAGVLTVYVLLAYVVAPRLWRHYEHHPSLATAPKTTTTPEGFAGDPLNVGFVGGQPEVTGAFAEAGWTPADPLCLRSDVEIAESILLDRADRAAPVSTQYLWGRRQVLAFEQEVGPTARQRHHVRLWHARELAGGNGPLWIGAATFDIGVGVSHRTGQVTHHIAPDIDAERDTLMAAVEQTRQVIRTYHVTGVGPTLRGRNGGGDWYYTDGEMTIAVLAPGNEAQAAPPTRLPDPPAVAIKNRVWSWLRALLAHKAPPRPSG
jgi:hypothetical protein